MRVFIYYPLQIGTWILRTYSERLGVHVAYNGIVLRLYEVGSISWTMMVG